MDRGTRRGHTDCPELRDPHTPPSRQPQGGASVPHPPPTRPPGILSAQTPHWSQAQAAQDPRQAIWPPWPSRTCQPGREQPVSPERPVAGSLPCVPRNMRLIPRAQKPYRRRCLLAEGEARLGHQAQPARGHALVSAGGTGARGHPGRRRGGEGGERGQQGHGQGAKWDPLSRRGWRHGDGRQHTHTHVRACAHTRHTPCGGPRSP